MPSGAGGSPPLSECGLAPQPRRGQPGAYDARRGTGALVRRVDRSADRCGAWHTAVCVGGLGVSPCAMRLAPQRAPPPLDTDLTAHTRGLRCLAYLWRWWKLVMASAEETPLPHAR